jgi:UDP-glucuronate 4-epimerase
LYQLQVTRPHRQALASAGAASYKLLFSMKILVTGAAGFIGSHLAERLAQDGHEVNGLDNFSDFYARGLKQLNKKDIEAKGVKFHELDLANDELKGLVQDVEIVYHLAAQPGLSPTTIFDTYLKNNLASTYNLLEAVKTSSTLALFVYGSTSSVYGAEATGTEDTIPQPTSFYGVTKLAAEQLALSYHRSLGLPVCSLRLFSVYGERERPEKLYPKLISSIINKTPFPLHEGSRLHQRSFTYIGDIVDGLVAALDRKEKVLGEIMNIGSDSSITTGVGIEIVEDIMGEKARIENMPSRSGDQIKTKANIEKAGKLLGYEPKTKPQEGLRKEVEWFVRNWETIKDIK